MSKGTADVCGGNEQLLVELEGLLERQIAAARADDLSAVEKLADECTERAAALKHYRGDRAQRLKQLHRQLECILSDKLAVTQQQLSHVQRSKKLFATYRPSNGE